VEKLESDKDFMEFLAATGVEDIVRAWGFELLNGNEQIVCVVKIGTDYKVRAVNLTDQSVVVPTNDVVVADFTATTFHQLTRGVGKFASSQIYLWDGADLTLMGNNVGGVQALGNDGVRMVAGFRTGSKFSRVDIISTNQFTGGAGVASSADYNSSKDVKAIVTLSSGIVLMGKRGAELHYVRENAVANAPDTDTKLKEFFYDGEGVDDVRRIDKAENDIFFINNNGIQEMKSYSGKASGLTDEGKIARYFRNFKIGESQAFYVAKEKLAYCLVASGVSNDVAVLIDYEKKERDVIVRSAQNYNGIAGINDRVFGFIGTKIKELFAGFSESVKFRWASEWDGLSSASNQKFLHQIVIRAYCNNNSKFRVKVRFDGQLDPIFEKEFTTPQPAGSFEGADWGNYTVGLGEFLETEEIGGISARNHNGGMFNTISIEIEEESAFPFRLQEIIYTYQETGIFNNEKVLRSPLLTIK